MSSRIYNIVILPMIQPQNVFIGSYSNSLPQPSIYDFNTKNMTTAKLNIPLVNPSYLLIRNSFIYVVQETNNGRLNVIDPEYNLKQTVETNGNDPCHISTNSDNNRIVVTNYSSGSFIMYELKNGLLGKMLAFVMHEGSSVNPDRQSSPHPHCSLFSQDGNTLFVTDLGTDIVYYYSVKYEGSQSLVCEKDKCLKLTGTGPRHLDRSSNNDKILYLTGELDSSIRVLSYASGKLEQLSAYRISNNPTNYPSEVHYYNNSVYMANRGDNYLIIFDIPELGVLKERFRFKVGEWPRHFNISAAGTIYVACQYENQVQRYRFEGGKIYQLSSLKISSPSCVNF